VRKVKVSTSVKLSSREYGCQQAPVVTTEKRASAFVNNEHWTEGLWFCVWYYGVRKRTPFFLPGARIFFLPPTPFSPPPKHFFPSVLLFSFFRFLRTHSLFQSRWISVSMLFCMLQYATWVSCARITYKPHDYAFSHPLILLENTLSLPLRAVEFPCSSVICNLQHVVSGSCRCMNYMS
jgi:hypothetical protein